MPKTLIQRALRLVVVVLFTLLFSSSIAQSPLYKHYSTKEGLPSSEVHQILQSKTGHIWFATDRGISKFDGEQFQNFTTENGLTNNAVFYITEDSKGRIWYFTINNELGYIKNNQTYAHPLNDTLQKMDFFFLFNDMHVDQNDTIWLGLKKAIAYKNINALKISPDNKIIPILNRNQEDLDRVHVIKVDSTHSICSSINSRKVSENINIRIDDRERTLVDEVVKIHHLNSVGHSNAHYLSNNEWFITIGKNLIRWNSKSQFISQKSEATFVANKVLYSNSSYWIPMHNKGLWNIKDLKSENVTPDNSYHSDQIASCVLQDHEGGIWVTTLSNGVYYYPEIRVKTYINSKNEVCQAQAIASHGDTVWTGLRNGIIKQIVSSQNKEEISDYEDLDGTIYYMNKLENGPLAIGSATAKTKHYYPANAACWLGGFRFLIKRENNPTLFLRGKSVDTLQNNRLTKMFQFENIKPIIGHEGPNETVWLGGMNGLYKMQDQRFLPQKNNHPILETRVNDLATWNNQLCVATLHKGLFFLENNSLTNLTIADGLSSNLLNAILIESDSILWAGTNNGLNRITRKNNQFTIQKFFETNGLPSKKINDLTISGDYLWIATDQGLSKFPKNVDLSNSSIPFLSINSVTVNSTAYSIDSLPEFNYKANSFLFDFKAISYNSATTYKYRIKEINTSWVTTTNSNIQVSILSPGTYTFEIKAAAINQKWTPIQQVQLVIVPPFWKTWTFYSILFVLITASALTLFQRKMNRMRKEAEQKQIELNNKNQIKLAQEQLEKEILEKELVQKEVDFKKREMVTYSIQLNKKNELLSAMKEELDELKNKVDSNSLKGIKRLINENLNIDNDWDSFKVHFNEVHPNFFEKLNTQYPSLSSGELKYCAYFKIQLSNKEIARLLNVTPKAIHIAKYRIKKKIDLGKDDNLMEFLLQFE